MLDSKVSPYQIIVSLLCLLLSFIVLVGKQMKHVKNLLSHIHRVQIHVFTYINETNVPCLWLSLIVTLDKISVLSVLSGQPTWINIKKIQDIHVSEPTGPS